MAYTKSLTTLLLTLTLTSCGQETTKEQTNTPSYNPTPISTEYEEEQGFIGRILQKGRSAYKSVRQRWEHSNLDIHDYNLDGKTEAITIKGTGLTTKILRPQHHFKGLHVIMPRNSMDYQTRKTADAYLQGKEEKYVVEQEIIKQLRK